VAEQETQAMHRLPLIEHASYALKEDFRATGLNVLHAD
jgi:hypothetical protein